MPTALYYPHTQIRDELFLKHALLVWDKVEFISPRRHFFFDESLSTRHREALELLCVSHVPSERERAIAHARIVNLLKDGVPSWLVTTTVPDSIREGRKVREFYGADYGIYPEKLDRKTWELLSAAGLVKLSGRDFDYYTRPLAGLYLMSLLAEACAGDHDRITDRTEAYAFLGRLFAAEAGAKPLASSKSARGKNLERLVTVSTKALNADDIPLKNILAMRKRESGTQGHDYRAFRQKYAKRLSETAEQIGKLDSKGDPQEIEDQFAQDMKDDLASLREELAVAKTKLLLSKEVGATVIVSAAAMLEPISGIALLSGALKTVAGGALVTDLMNFVGNYKKALKDHPMSWLYLTESPGLRTLPFRDF